jgi:hypothetical protein
MINWNVDGDELALEVEKVIEKAYTSVEDLWGDLLGDPVLAELENNVGKKPLGGVLSPDRYDSMKTLLRNANMLEDIIYAYIE